MSNLSSQLRYDGKVVIVTGAGGGLGKAYATFFASRGASVVVNDLGGSFKGEGTDSKAADVVVEEIKKAGGKAVADYNSVVNGDKIVETAVKAFGTVHILLNNAGILRDVSFKNMKDQDWDLIWDVHVKGSYKTAKACWPLFRKQKYGRIINTASAAGLYGSFGQTNYSAAKLGMVAFTETLAKEGAKYNIVANVIAPIAASRMTATVMDPETLSKLGPEWVVPLVGYLVHENNKDNGGIYEVGAGAVAKLRWERAKGALFRLDESFTPSAVLKKWPEVQNFKEPVHPGTESGINHIANIENAAKLPPNEQGEKLDFSGKVALVTGAGGGLGRAYALLFAKLGASVVVNDVGNPDKVVEEIKAAGGKAVGDRHSVEDGEAVIKTCLNAFGGIHVIVNNAGILRDKSFAAMTDQQWDDVQRVHVRGTYKVCKAAWPHLYKQKYGRIINTASSSGIYGNFGQANYATAKLAIVGFTRALAREGQKNNILVNVIAPTAGTDMTRTIMPEEVVAKLKPEYIAPTIVLLGHEKAPTTCALFEVGPGFTARLRWERTAGVHFPTTKQLTPEDIAGRWKDVIDFSSNTTHPDSPAEATSMLMEGAKAQRPQKAAPGKGASGNAVLEKAQSIKVPEGEYKYDNQEVILYNLGLGAKKNDLKWVFEGASDFEVLPTFGVVPQFQAQSGFPLAELLPNFSPMMLLHGEQFLEIKKFPIPTSATLVTTARVIDVLDKGKAASVTIGTTTKDKNSGEVIFENQATVFIRGSGGFGGPSKGADRGAATAANTPPSRAPDTVVEEKTSEDQAALYRLSGDRNPLHVDPEFSKVGGFPVPILHGLCFFGISGKHIYQKYGPFKNIKVRFAGTVIPGETLVTEMWKEGNKVIFQTKVKERNAIAITSAAAELVSGDSKSSSKPTASAGGDSIEVPGFGASKVFAQAKAQLDATSPKDKAAKLKKANGIFQFDVTNDAGKTESWTIDAKNEGTIKKGPATKPDVTIILKDNDLVSLSTGKGSAQSLFMSGKLKIKGNMMKAVSIGDLIAPPKAKV